MRARGNSTNGTVQHKLPVSLDHQVVGMPPKSVSQGQGQDDVSLPSASSASHESYDIDDTLDVSVNMMSCDPRSIATLSIALTA